MKIKYYVVYLTVVGGVVDLDELYLRGYAEGLQTRGHVHLPLVAPLAGVQDLYVPQHRPMDYRYV